MLLSSTIVETERTKPSEGTLFSISLYLYFFTPLSRAIPIAHNPSLDRCVSGNTGSLMQQSSNFDPPIARNLAYRSAAQTITLNPANQADVTYEYVS